MGNPTHAKEEEEEDTTTTATTTTTTLTAAQQQHAEDDAQGLPKNRFTHGVDKLWHIPPELKTGDPVKLGIDEAGRGPVMGPMVYAAAFWRVAEDAAMVAMGFDDSKALDEKTRDGLFQRMLRTKGLGWVIHSIPATELAGKMLMKEPTSLNKISHDSAADMISLALAEGVCVTEVFVDTVGDPEMYQRKLEGLFSHRTPRIAFTVAKKADSLYKTVSAASIAAKVTRDRAVSGWMWEEAFAEALPTNFGSGYPGDARCSDWLKAHSDGVFGFPSIVRFSWSTAREHMEKHCVGVTWEDDEDTSLPTGTASIEAFMKPKPGAPKKARKRAKYFTQRGIETVGDF